MNIKTVTTLHSYSIAQPTKKGTERDACYTVGVLHLLMGSTRYTSYRTFMQL